MIKKELTAMNTAAETLQDLKETITNFEQHMRDTQVTPATLTQAQNYLDDLEKQHPPKDRSTDPRMLFHMYEFQALIDTAKGNLHRAKAFVSEAVDVHSGEDFASETVQALAMPGAGKNPKIDFFVVSGWRLFIMTLLSAGLYGTYWFYKNWKAVEKATGRKQHAILSAIFAVFFSYGLFLEVRKAADDANYQGNFTAGGRAIGFFFFGVLALFGTQRVMRETGAKDRKTYGKGEIIMLILGLLYWGMIIISAVVSSSTGTSSSRASRAAFMDSCTSEASSSDVFTSSEASTYCGCVYDTGVSRFGRREFLSKAVEINSTNVLDDDVSTIINDCVDQVQSI